MKFTGFKGLILSKLFFGLFVAVNFYALIILSIVSKVAKQNYLKNQVLGAKIETKPKRLEANWRQYVQTSPQKKDEEEQNTSALPINNLNAWWSNMEYSGKVIASVYADKLISCTWQLTLIGETGQIISRTTPPTTDTCKFEADTYFKPYKLWVRAKSLDGETREFGVK